MELYQFLLEQRQIFSISPEKCPFTAHQNCFALNSNGERVPKNNVLVMEVKEPKLVKKVLNDEIQDILELWSGTKVSKKL